MESILNNLFNIFRYENCTDYKTALDIVLLAMDRHPGEKVIQISGSACLYYVLNGGIGPKLNAKVRRKILATLLNAMFAHRDHQVMLRNGCLILCQFQIPQDVVSILPFSSWSMPGKGFFSLTVFSCGYF